MADYYEILGVPKNASTADIRNALRLHGTLPQQYTQFTWGLVRHGSVGRSYFNRRTVPE